MTKAAERLLEQVLQLDPADRTELIDRLWGSTDPVAEDAAGEPDPDYDAAWAAELRERKAQVERGEDVTVPWREAMARIRRGVTDGE